MNQTDNEQPIRILLVGASGVVGQQVLHQALVDERVAKIISLTRKPLPPHRKLENPVLDFSNIPQDAAWWQIDAVICTLGTTIKVAGSQSAFAAVDRDLPVKIATLARAAGATRFALNSSLGAKNNGNFYLRTKAEAEAGIRKLSFPCYTIVRPSLIDANRNPARSGEKIGLLIAHLLRPIIPKRFRPVKPEMIALALLEAVLDNQPGERIIESESIPLRK